MIVSASLWIFAAACYSILSVMHFRYDVSIFRGNSWFDPKLSYTRKYKYPTLAPSNWYYRILGVKYKEKFFGSSWLFVGLTDGFHAFQHIMLLSIIGAMLSLPNLVNTWQEYACVAIILHIIWTLTHQICYRWLFIKKEYRH
jgi:hypothetical protein